MNVNEWELFAGFQKMNVFRDDGIEESMQVKVNCGANDFMGLIDTGCYPNLICMDAFERMSLEDMEGSMFTRCDGEIKGVGNLSVAIVGMIKMKVIMEGIEMGECEYHIMNRKSEKYEIILGYNFLSKNRLIIHPAQMMIEKKGENDSAWQMYLGRKEKVSKCFLKGCEVRAAESVKLSKEHPVSVKIEYDFAEVPFNNCQRMLYLDGERCHYKVKRVACVYNEVIDITNPFVYTRKV